MFKDIEQEIGNFYDLPELEQQALLNKIQSRGKKDIQGFKRYLSETGYGNNSDRSIFYEAIWTNPAGWEEFLFTELQNLVSAAENGNKDAIDELSSMVYLTKIETTDDSFYTKCLNLLTTKLQSLLPEVRVSCLEAILDIAEIGKKKLDNKQILALQNLLNDPVFKVKIFAYANLKESDLLPVDFKLSFFDKTRAQLMGMGALVK